jgi:hypothetical protein
MNTKRSAGLGHGVLVLAAAAVGAMAWSGCSAQGSVCGGYACSGPPEEWGGSVPSYEDGGPAFVGGDDAGSDGTAWLDANIWIDAQAFVDSNAPDTSVTVPLVCAYSSQCASGDVCADGQCLHSCATTACPANDLCTKGVCEPNAGALACTTSGQCPAMTPICAGGQCSAACTSSAQCTTGDYCDQGACQLDTRPTPDCARSSDCTGAAPQVCVNGFCEYPCTTSQQCAEIDVRIDVCSPQGYCASGAEANPQCTQKSDCAAGQDCIGNVCE